MNQNNKKNMKNININQMENYYYLKKILQNKYIIYLQQKKKLNKLKMIYNQIKQIKILLKKKKILLLMEIKLNKNGNLNQNKNIIIN